jgi:hypothetical protein
MLGLVGRKKHEAEVRELREVADREIDRLKRTMAAQDHQNNQAVKAGLQALADAQRRTVDAEDRANVAEIACKSAETECARIAACHATRVRIGWIPIDPIEMTARIRAVEGSLRVEWDGDKLVIYAGRPLTEAEFNAAVAAFMPQLNRT